MRCAFVVVFHLAIAILLVGCGDKVEKKRDVGFKGPARLNDFLAAERFLQEMGLNVSSTAVIPSLQNNSDSAIILPLEVIESRGIVWELSDWVAQGGNLFVYLPADGYHIFEFENNEFLEYFEVGIEDWTSKDTEIDSSLGHYEDDGNFKTKFKTPALLTDTSDPDALPEWYQNFSWDNGSVTVFATTKPFSNRVLGKEQHASLLWSFFAQHTGKVFFVRGAQPSIFTMMWRANPFAVVIGFLTIVLLIWWAARGLGPRYKGQTEPEPQLDEHLHATGNFLRRQKAEGEVLSEVQTAIVRKLARKLNLPPLTSQEAVLNDAFQKEIISAEDYKILSSSHLEQNSVNFYRYLQQLQKQT